MKIQYDSELGYQKEAIDAVVDIFQGQETCESNFTVYSPEYLAQQKNLGFSDVGVGNRLTLTEGQILQNVQSTQLTNGLKPSPLGEVDRKNLDLMIEMETGTGKTYVYLRTIMSCMRNIVSPSIL